MTESAIPLCLKASSIIKDGRTRLETLAHATEELGECSLELRIEEGRSKKEIGEGVVGEAIDVIITAMDLIYLSKPDITEDEINQLVRKKLDKWLGNVKPENIQKEPTVNAAYPVFLGIFDDAASVYDNFSDYIYSWTSEPSKEKISAERAEMEEYELLFGYYSYEDYSGHAFVLARKDGQLYEVNGSHCSCYGLEGQWSPEETSIKLLRDRMDLGNLGYYYSYTDEARKSEFADELRQVLDALEQEGQV